MRIGVWWAVALGAGCGGGGQSPVDAPVDPPRTVVELPATLNRNVDVLFVVDDSSSMAEQQQNLAVNFPDFINVLNTVSGGLPDLHLGVVSTDMGTQFSGSATPAPPVGMGTGSCSSTGKDGRLQLGTASGITGNFISDIKLPDGTRQKNYDGCSGGNLATCFGDMARLGSNGCGFEQPLAAMKRALVTPANAGFVRDDALLVVLFLTDEDDCSAKSGALFGPDSAEFGAQDSFRCTRFGITCADGGATPDEMTTEGLKGRCSPNSSSTLLDDVAPFHDVLVDLKSDPRKVIVGGIIGNPEPVEVELRTVNGSQRPALAHSCLLEGPDGIPSSPDDSVADPGVRLQAFFDQFPDRSTSGTICQQDLAASVADLGELVKFGIGSPCVQGSLEDADPTMPGLQPDCFVEDVVGSTTTLIPPCPAPTCWQLVTDPIECPSGDNLKLEVTREVTPDPATVTRMRCGGP